MRIAIISFDQEFAKKIKDSLGDEHQVRIYIDSLGMLRDLKEFTPDIIIYDASAGEFAIDDLKFLMTRDKLENIEFKIFISKIEPINVDELPKNIPKEIYYKDEDGINKLIVKLKSTELIEQDFSQDLLGDTGADLKVEEEKGGTDLDNLLSQSPEDIEDLLMGGSDLTEEKPKKEEKKKETKPPSDDIFQEDIPLDELENILGEFSLGEESKKEVKEEPKKEEKVKAKKETESFEFNPEDIEDLLGLGEPEPKKEKKKEVVEKAPEIEEPVVKKEKKKSPKDDFLSDIEELITPRPKAKPKVEKKEESEEERVFKTEDIETSPKVEEVKEEFKEAPIETFEAVEKPERKVEEEFIESYVKSGTIKLEINISEEEIKRLIVNETVSKMVEELKNDRTLKELIENIQKDFIDRTERELETLKESVKIEVKTRLLKKIEDDLKEKVKESIKKDVMEITTKLVKQKLEQLFGK